MRDPSETWLGILPSRGKGESKAKPLLVLFTIQLGKKKTKRISDVKHREKEKHR